MPRGTQGSCRFTARPASRGKSLSEHPYMCGVCGSSGIAAHCLKALGKKTVIVNADGCFTLLSVYPFTPFQNSWLYTAMACAPAGAQGIRDALDILIKKEGLIPEKI